MYSLYAEDASDPETVILLKDLRSKRFYRALREAMKEPRKPGYRMFVAKTEGTRMANLDPDRVYLDPRDEQVALRQQAQRNVTVTTAVSWEGKP